MHLLRICTAALLFAALSITAQPMYADGGRLKEGIENYFSHLKSSFDQIVEAPVVKKSKFSLTDRYFIGVLRRHQPIYKLLRTNSKGVVINEVIRGESPERTFRNLSAERWYRRASQNWEEVHFTLLGEQGRQYLFWSKPVMIRPRSRRKRFVGAVAAKIDLWDAFHEFSNQTTVPFLIRLNGRSLYSHKWQQQKDYEEQQLEIPGCADLTVRFAAVPTFEAITESAAGATHSALSDSPGRDTTYHAESASAAPNGMTAVLLIAAVCVIVLLTLTILILFTRLRHYRTVHQIESGD